MPQILASMNGILEASMMVLAAALVVGFEMRRCSQGLAIKRILKTYMPETIGLALLAVIAGALRAKGPPESSIINEEIWNELVRSWPLLMTADTLLALQAMIRFLLFNSLLLRLDKGRCAQALETSALFLAAMSVRVGLYWYNTAYRLEGPLGGQVSGSFEFASLLPLTALVFCSGRWTWKALFLILITIAASASVAWHHHLKLAGDIYVDSAFTWAHCLETCAAIAHLLQAGSVAGAYGSGIIALGLPAQHILSAYYFLEAFEANPALVGAGYPFEFMWFTGVSQLGIYLLSGAVYLACLAEGFVAGAPNAMPHATVSQVEVSRLSDVVF